MKIERILDHAINLDNFERTQEVKRVYVNDSGKILLKDQSWTMDWSLEHKREVAADLQSDDYIAYAAYENERIIGFVSVAKKLLGHRMVLNELNAMSINLIVKPFLISQ